MRLPALALLAFLAGCVSIPSGLPQAFHCDACDGHHRFYAEKVNPVWWFGNADDPLPSSTFAVGWPQPLRWLGWYIRNPFHNFFFYVLGDADQPTIAYGHDYPNGPPAGHCAVSYTRHVGGGLYFPFINCGGNPQFYAGWRPGGELGFALRANHGG